MSEGKNLDARKFPAKKFILEDNKRSSNGDAPNMPPITLGLKYRYPEAQRSCKKCALYPCMTNQEEVLKLDFARCGCRKFTL